MAEKELTRQQALFVQEYVVDGNATQAAIRAGYSAKTATEQGSRLLTIVKVKNAVDIAMKERVKRTHLDQDAFHHHLKRSLDINGQLVETEDGVSKFVSDTSYNKAIEMTGRSLQLFSDKVELVGKDGKDLIPETTDDELARRVAFMLQQAVKEK